MYEKIYRHVRITTGLTVRLFKTFRQKSKSVFKSVKSVKIVKKFMTFDFLPIRTQNLVDVFEIYMNFHTFQPMEKI